MGWSRRRSRGSDHHEMQSVGDDQSPKLEDSRSDLDAVADADAESKANADSNFEALVDAVRKGDVVTLKQMFKDNLDVSVLMFDVAHRENPAVLDALLQPQHDSRDSTRIRKAVMYNRVNSMRSLLEAGVETAAPPDEFGHTIIQYAVIHDTLASLLGALRLTADREDVSVTVVDEGSDCDDTTSVIHVRDQLRMHILQTNFEGRNAFHTAAYLGDTKNLKLLYDACDRDADLDAEDKEGHTPLSLAVRSGYPDCVKFLVKSGSDLGRRYKWGPSAVQMLLQDCPRGHEIMEKVLDSTVNEDGRINFSVLVGRNSAAQLETTFLMFRFARREHWDLLSHPVIECLVAIKWNQVAPLFWLKFVAYLLFIAFLSAYVVATTMEVDNIYVMAFRIPVFIFSAVVILLSVFFVYSTPKHFILRLLSIVVRLAPPVCGIVYVAVDDPGTTWSDKLGAFVVLGAWLALLTKLDVVPYVSHQAYMFIQICYSMFKYLLVFVCVSLGFSLSYFVLMHDSHQFRNPWRAFLYTNLVLLQGGMDSLRLFDEREEADLGDSIAAGVLTLLFLLLMIIGVLNMLVGLAVRSSEELITDGRIFCQMNKVETLYGLDKFLVRRPFRGCLYLVPRVTNVKYLAVPKKLKLRLQNLRRKRRRHVTDEDNQKVLNRLDELESRLNQIMAAIMVQQKASRNSIKTM